MIVFAHRNSQPVVLSFGAAGILCDELVALCSLVCGSLCAGCVVCESLCAGCVQAVR